MAALEVRVEGAAKLRRLAAQIRAEGDKGLSRQMSEALSRAIEPVRESIRASAAEAMPRTGGYQAVFDKSLRFRKSQRNSGTEASVILATYAEGGKERRDVPALEAGRLRHPVWGRSRPGARKGERHANPWAVTSIRAGFWKRGTAKALDEAQKRMEDVIDDFASRLAK
jgi:hypothetical protein